MAQARRWEDLSPAKRRVFIVLGVLQMALLLAALIDLRRRPEDEIRGTKRVWSSVVFVNWIGPLAYFLYGRRRSP